MSEARRLQVGLLLSLLINATALLLVGWLWRWQPVPTKPILPRIKLVRVALRPPTPPAPKPVPVVVVRPVPPPVPKPHPVRPKPVPRHRRPGSRVKKSSPAPAAKPAGGSDAGAAAPPVPAPPPQNIIASEKPAPLEIHRVPTSLPPLPTPSFLPSAIAAPRTAEAVPSVAQGHGASGAGASGRGQGAGEGSGSGSGIGSGSSADAGEPFGVGKGLAGDGGPRHVVYVLDISGSMVSRISRADSEIRKALAGLRPDETFDIIAFNSDVQPFNTELSPATPSMVRQASVFLSTLQVTDGTNLEGAMIAALALPDVNEVVLLTDGVPTIGEQDFGTLARLIRRRNRTRARISTVGMVGRNPDGTDDSFEAAHLLQQIAADSGGASKIVPLGVATP